MRLFVVACMAALALALVVGCSGSQGEQRSIAAYVGDDVVYEDEITDYTKEFRAQRGYEDDATWAEYLTEEGLTGTTWRESVIRQKADRILVQRKADELGIAPDSAAVEQRVASMREQAGAADDDAAWEDYLAQSGRTPEEIVNDLEFSSVEQQVISAEVDFSGELRSQMCDDYISTNLADQVVRHYYAFEFDSEAQDDAQALLDELAALDESKLVERFVVSAQADGESDVVEVAEGDASAIQATDLGWDFAYAEYDIDPDLALRKAKLNAGELYREVLYGADTLRVVLCAERVELSGISYDDIPSVSLKEYIASLTLTSQWAALTSQYLSELEKAADVQVVPMPEGLPYDVSG